MPRVSVDGPVEKGHTRNRTVSSVGSVKTATSGEAEMRKALAAGEQEQTETDEVKEAVVPKIRIGPEDLSKYGESYSCCV